MAGNWQESRGKKEEEDEAIDKVRKVEESRTEAIGDQRTKRPERRRWEGEGKAALESLRCKSEDVGR
jgi:hypothetical protein